MYNTDIDKLEKALLSLDPDVCLEPVRQAYDTAHRCHYGQTRDEGVHYFVHPFRVALYLVEKIGITDPEVIASALLHDVLEDCREFDVEKLERAFGRRIAGIVEELSKPPLSGGQSRARRDEDYYRQINNAGRDVVLIKLADRLDNLRSLHLSPRKNKMQRYITATRKHLLPLGRKYFPLIAEELEKTICCLRDFLDRGEPGDDFSCGGVLF